MAHRSDAACEYSMNSRDSENWHRPDVSRRLGHDEWTSRRDDGSHDWRCPHDALEGEARCIFHLPRDHEKKDPERQNRRFSEAVNDESNHGIDARRRRQFIGAVFVDLDLSEERISPSEDVPINLKHSVFAGETNWTGTVFEAPVQTNGATFEGELKSANATFVDRTGFQAAKFGQKANFNSAQFRSPVHFTDAVFARRAIFNHAEFQGRAHFDLVRFEGEASFFQSEFDGPSYFSSEREGDQRSVTEFRGPARFSGTTFRDDCQFIDVRFRGEVDFSRVAFRKYTGFSGTEFDRGLNFEKAVFEDRNYFRGIDPDGPITFDRSRFVGEGFFDDAELSGGQFRNADLEGVDFSDAVLAGSSFRSSDLTGADFLRADLTGANLEDAIIDKTDLRYANLSGTLWYHAFLADVRLNDETAFGGMRGAEEGVERIENTCQYEVLASHGPSSFDSHDEVADRRATELWNEAAWIYNRLEQVCRKNAMPKKARTYHYKKGEADRHHYRKRGQWGNYFILWAHRLLTGYGDRFAPIGWWAVGTIVVSATLYLLFGIENADGAVHRGVNPMDPAGQEAILQSLQFSIATFGFGSLDVVPLGYSNVVVILESMLGTLLFGLLAFVLARRLP